MERIAHEFGKIQIIPQFLPFSSIDSLRNLNVEQVIYNQTLSKTPWVYDACFEHAAFDRPVVAAAVNTGHKICAKEICLGH